MGKVAVVVVAAGRGSRMGTAISKQFLELGGAPIVVHTLRLFQQFAAVDEIVVVTGAADVALVESYREAYGLSKMKPVIVGGAERQQSVHHGLRALGLEDAAVAAQYDAVLVHDAVRPFPAVAHLEAVLAAVCAHGAAVLAVPVKDTIKVVDAGGVIRSTPDRRTLWAIQTPQAFRADTLWQAYERAEADGFTGTDDAMLVERLGVSVRVVEADYYNIKITTPEDLPWAEWILKERTGHDPDRTRV